MIASGASVLHRLRLPWTVRLMAMELRRHRGRVLVTLGAFAVLVLAIATSVACLRAERAGAAARFHAPAAPISSAISPLGAGEAQLIALLRDDLPVSPRDALATALRRLPGVSAVRVLDGEQVLARMREELGDHASVLDGVEEGFLPATLEISLEASEHGAGRANAIAARLRRMEGIAEVDVLRAGGDLSPAAVVGHHLAQAGVALGCLAALLALGLAMVAARRSPADGQLMAGLGFTPAALAFPAALTCAACAIVGGLAGVGLIAGALHLGVGSWLGELPVPAPGGGTWRKSAGAALAAVAVIGTGIGWWGALSPAYDGEALAAAD